MLIVLNSSIIYEKSPTKVKLVHLVRFSMCQTNTQIMPYLLNGWRKSIALKGKNCLLIKPELTCFMTIATRGRHLWVLHMLKMADFKSAVLTPRTKLYKNFIWSPQTAMETCPNGEKTLAKNIWEVGQTSLWKLGIFSQICNLRPNQTKFGQLFFGNPKAP